MTLPDDPAEAVRDIIRADIERNRVECMRLFALLEVLGWARNSDALLEQARISYAAKCPELLGADPLTADWLEGQLIAAVGSIERLATMATGIYVARMMETTDA